MLERIKHIKGVGLLHDANGDNFKFEKATLIYADNGRGKTTLASILRSISTGDTTLITDRKTIDGVLSQSIAMHFGSGHKVNFDNDTWSEKRPELIVFDSDFIDRNVHSGGSVNTEHRKNLLEFEAPADPAIVDQLLLQFQRKNWKKIVHSVTTQLNQAKRYGDHAQEQKILQYFLELKKKLLAINIP